MSEIKRILLVPERGDPHGLLAEGLGGARPPIAYIPNGGWKWTEGPCMEEYPLGRALVLAWEREVVAEGCLYAEAALERMNAAEVPGWRMLRDSAYVILKSRRTLPFLRRVLAPLGTIVLIDAEGQEVNND